MSMTITPGWIFLIAKIGNDQFPIASERHVVEDQMKVRLSVGILERESREPFSEALAALKHTVDSGCL